MSTYPITRESVWFRSVFGKSLQVVTAETLISARVFGNPEMFESALKLARMMPR